MGTRSALPEAPDRVHFFENTVGSDKLALDAIGAMHLVPGHKRYLIEAQLLLAAIYLRQGVSGNAAMAAFRLVKPDWNLRDEMAVNPFDKSDAAGKVNHDLWEKWAGAALLL